MTNDIKLVAAIVVVCGILLGAFVFWGPKGTGVELDPALLVKATSHMTGNISAKVTLVEFADFQCPACATVAPYIKGIVDSYKDNPDFNFVYRNFPLSQHANAVISAEAAESAGAQGKYFEMVEVLYQNQAEWSDVSDPTSLFIGYATTLALDVAKFTEDINSHRFQTVIAEDLADATALRLNHTPFLILNGVEVTDLGSLQAQIEAELAR